MYRILLLTGIVLFIGCKEAKIEPTAQEIVDRSIEICGGENYLYNTISFDFRGKKYQSIPQGNQKILQRKILTDSTEILDVRSPNGFERFVNDSLVILPDTLATAYSNAVNSVHYFAYLPYGLNDKAVQKRFLGMATIGATEYYEIEVTFNENGGGDDFDDIYIYWFNTKTYKPDYLAYEFHVDGGGQRFRVAYNERIVKGIRFVDYKNYKSPNTATPISSIDSLYTNEGLELLSEIKLEDIKVTQDSYN